MALIIKADMPKSCLGELDGRNDCPWVGKCETFSKSHFNERVNKSWEQRLDGCPLVEIPDEHGRLVDADILLADHPKTANWDYMVLECIIRNAPTVVEASK